MAWPGSSKIYAYTILASMNKLTGSQTCSADTYKIALYGTGTPVNTATTLAATEYGTTWNTCTEVANSGTYTAGGSSLVSPTSTQSTNTWVFACTTANSWTGATITADGALIYDSTVAGNPGLGFLDFLGAQSVTSGTFTVTYAPDLFTITLT